MKLIEWTMEEQEQLIHFLMTNSWPFHVNEHPGRTLIEKTIDEGGYASDEVKTFWVEDKNNEKVGLVKIYDLQDEIPLFDLRIADSWRGHGYGPAALKLVTEYVFQLPSQKIRLEGHTRQDNFAMRKAFERAGFVKEAHLRDAWFVPKDARYYDAVTYGVTRTDFFEGKTTPLDWEDGTVVKRSYVPNFDFDHSFESERLIIRIPRLEDTEACAEAIEHSYYSLKEFMPWAQKKATVEERKENIRQAIADFIARKDLRMHIFNKETGDFIGSCGLHRIDWSIPKFEIGYWLDTRFEGKGYMTETVERMTVFAFEELQAERVEIRCDVENKGSKAIPERLGYELDGIFKNDALSADGQSLRDTCIYSKIRSTYYKK